MKYIIVESWQSYEADPEVDPSIETKVHLVDTLDDVRQNLDVINRSNHDWAVFEVVDGRAVRRSVTFLSTVSLS